MSINYNQLDQYQKYMIACASLFHSIYVPRYNNNGDLIKYIVVPIVFAQNDKLYDIANSNTLINQINNNTIETNYPVPSMAFEINGVVVDDDRKISELNVLGEDDQVYSPLPIKLNITLSIETKKLADMLKIFEQILPMFPNKQALIVNVNINFNDEIKVVMGNIATNFPSEVARNVSDMFTADFEFTIYCKSYKIPKQPIANSEYEFVLKTIDNNNIDTLLLEG